MDWLVFPKCDCCNPNHWVTWIASSHNDRFNKEMDTPMYRYEQEQVKLMNS